MTTVVMQYHDLGKWKWNSDKQCEVYADGKKLGTYTGMKPDALMKVIRKRLGIKRAKRHICQWISPQQRATEDLHFMIYDTGCPVETFWENVGKDRKEVMSRIKQISEINDEHEYNTALRKLMNEYI